MTDAEIISWVKTEFKPLVLATPEETIMQFINNSRRYWNTHSAWRVTRMVNYTSGANYVEVDLDIKRVSNVYPSRMTESLFSDHPMWVLLGFISLDRYTQDMMLLSHTYEGYKIYLGSDFRWTFERGEDLTKKGKLFLQNVPKDAAKLAVVGSKRFVDGEEIKDDFILEWLLRYVKALVKMNEGNVWRKSSIINIQNDGQAILDEGKAEADKLQEDLRKEGRWQLFAKRK